MQLGHNRKMTGAQCLADMLKGYGVTHVFHVPAVLRSTYAEMERRETGIKRLHVHGEKAAAYMADGYARASGKPASATRPKSLREIMVLILSENAPACSKTDFAMLQR